MTRQRFAHTIGLLCILMVLLIHTTNCSKEYSYKGGPAVDTTSSVDTTVGNGDTTSNSSLQLPICPSCYNGNEVKPNTWMFTVNKTVVCGMETKAVKSATGTAMTFFGPSACSQDTGLIITAYFSSLGLSADAANLSADRVALEYYDKVTPSQIAQTVLTNQFSLIIERYNQQTGEATGTFNGQAITARGEMVTITDGRFNIKFD